MIPSKSKTLWWQSPKYIYEDIEIKDYEKISLNMMMLAKKFCYSSGWNNRQLLKILWKNTAYAGRQKGKFEFPIEKCIWGKNYGGGRKYYAPYIRIRRGFKEEGGYIEGEPYSTGRGGACYGVTMTYGFNPAGAMVTLLHELCHVDQAGKYQKLNNRRRPHDLDFNVQQWLMAKKFWGYDFHPESVGWSIGKGYAPTRHMSKWLHTEIYENKNEKIINFIKNI